MKKIISVIVLLFSDVFFIFISILTAVFIRGGVNLFLDVPRVSYSYIKFGELYITLIFIFYYFGIYSKRFDFWHESKIIIRACFLSFLLLFAGLALGKNSEYYSRSTLCLVFIFCSIYIPFSKLFIKRFLFKLGFWQKHAKVISDNSDFKSQLFEDHYLGYVKATSLERGTIFIDSQLLDKNRLNKIIESNINKSREIIFTPVLNDYDFSQSYIYNMFNSRVNVFSLENKLLDNKNKIIKCFMDYIIVLFTSFLWLPMIGVISIILKLEDPKGTILFKQKRLGINGKEFVCYKFRTMYSDQSFMEKWLDDNPAEKEYYSKYHKYINDPRITKIGDILRKTSLDEIPQLLNVIKGDMSLVGPRPYMLSEKEDMGKKANLILSVKPGITGLWQVSGRSQIDFSNRIDMDVWYMKNWSLWNDTIILIKTLKIVLKRDGAY